MPRIDLLGVLLSIGFGVALAQPDAGASKPKPEPVIDAFDRDLPRAPLTQSEVSALAKRLKARIVKVRRPHPRDPRYRVPGGVPAQLGEGWIASDNRVITASALVAEWPRTKADTLEVKVGDRWVPAAVGLMEAELGLAVLDVPGAKASEKSIPPAVGAVFIGRPLYFVADGNIGLAKVGIPATGQRAYYIWLLGVKLPLGTPLFDGSGRVLSVVGLDAPDQPLRSLILPEKAVRALFERAPDWME